MTLSTDILDDSYFFVNVHSTLHSYFLILPFHLNVVFLQVQVAEESYIHLRIFRVVPSKHGEVELEEILDEKKDSDPLEAFEVQSGAVAAN